MLGSPIAPDFQKLEAERLDLAEHSEESGLVGQRPGKHGLAATLPGVQAGEGGEQRLPEVPTDAYLALQGSCRSVHGASIAHKRMSGHPPDGVSRWGQRR